MIYSSSEFLFGLFYAGVRAMVFSDTFNNIPVISWQSV